MSVFGGTAIFLESNNLANISEAVNSDLSTSLFVLLQHFPLSELTSMIGIFLVTIFFVTSSDSGSLVVDSITSGGKLDAPVGQRIFWALLEGAVAAALLFAGGLKAMQSVVISAGLPFAVILLMVVFSLNKAFRKDTQEMRKKAYRKEQAAYAARIKELLEIENEDETDK
jgi:choline/glycine/proline betaine transport protein